MSKSIDALSKRVVAANKVLLAASVDEVPLDDLWFRANVWDQFRPQAVWDVLLDQRHSFPGQKEVACAAFIGWLCAGQKQQWIRAVSATAIGEFMQAAERKALRNFSKYGVAADMVARYSDIGSRFLQSIYYQAGGISALRKYNSSRTVKNKFVSLSDNVAEIVLAMQYFDAGFAADGVITPNFSNLAKNSKLIGLSGHNRFETIWRNYKKQSALIYAASIIDYQSGTLLHHFLSGKSNWNNVGKYLPILAAYAQTITDQILVPLDAGAKIKSDLCAANAANLPSSRLPGVNYPRHFVSQLTRLFPPKLV